MVSTRSDLLPPDVALELAKLQDRVPPFPAEIAVATIERSFQRPLAEIFVSFEQQPVASASIAQVHFAVLRDRNGVEHEVAVKVLRPGMLAVIDKDLQLMHMMARWVERLSADAKRLKPRQVIAEFDNYLHDELDLIREAANAAQLRRNMEGMDLVLIPEIHWDFCHPQVMVMERMKGVPISQIERLREAGVDIPQLARDGVTLFFTQVFRDGFFHGDMHPGNIQVSLDPQTFGRYISIDFGIVGTLTEFDKEYLAQNFTAFFRRIHVDGAAAHRFGAAIAGHGLPAVDEIRWRAGIGQRQRVPAQLVWRRRRHGVEIADDARVLQQGKGWMLAGGTDAVQPGTAVLRARRREGRAGELFRVQAQRRLLRRVLPLRQGAGHGLRGKLVAEAALVAGAYHAGSARPSAASRSKPCTTSALPMAPMASKAKRARNSGERCSPRPPMVWHSSV